MERMFGEPEGHWKFPVNLPYSHAVRSGNLVFIGGQIAVDQQGKVLFKNDIVEQTKLVMQNIKAALESVGATLQDVVKVNRFYVGTGTQEDWAKSATVCASYFGVPGPVATGIPVPTLALEGLMTEIEVIAIIEAK